MFEERNIPIDVLERLPAPDFAIEIPITRGPGGLALEAFEPGAEFLHRARIGSRRQHFHDIAECLDARAVQKP